MMICSSFLQIEFELLQIFKAIDWAGEIAKAIVFVEAVAKNRSFRYLKDKVKVLREE